MKTIALLAISLLFAAQPVHAAASEKPRCLKDAEVTNQMDPPQLYESMKVCLKQKKKLDAAFLFYLASSYGLYDVARVPDTTRHEAARNIIKAFSETQSKAEQDEFAEFLTKQMAAPPEMYPICKKIFAAGPPMYEPTYMAGEGGKVLKDFDINLYWLTTLSKATRCPVKNLQLNNITHKP